MCQSAAEGGRRCAAHTRPGFQRALMTFGAEQDAAKRARLVEEHADAIIEHAVTPKGKTEVAEAIARIETAYAERPSRTAAEETGRAEYVYALKKTAMRASLRRDLEHAGRTTHALARTGRPAPEVVECETGAVSRPRDTNVHNDALAQRWFEQSAQALAQGRYVTPRSGGATAETPVHLEVQTYQSVTREGRQTRTAVTNRLLSASPTTCGKPGHSASMVRTTSSNPANDINADDCACDAACTHCGAAEGQTCTTNDGGGMSGGGYTAKSHSKRIKASARIQGLKDGTRSRCDLGDHQWAVTADGASATCTGTCGRTEPVHPSSRRLNRLTPAGSASGQ